MTTAKLQNASVTRRKKTGSTGIAVRRSGTKAKAAVSLLTPASGLYSEAKNFGVGQTDLVRMTGFSPRTVGSWAAGKAPTGPARKVLAETTRILKGLAEIMDENDVVPWLKEPNHAFDGSTPLQVIERGEADRIWRMIYQLESGEPG